MDLKEPSSFCTICTYPCKQELIGFLLSLSLHHKNSKVYIICDTKTKEYIIESTPSPKLDIKWYIELDKFTNYNRAKMEKEKIFGEFLSYKMKCMEYALQENRDAMFIDSDTIILDKLHINENYNLGLSPQFIKEETIKRSGYYNAGLLWCNAKEIVNYWREIINHEHSCAEQINMIKLRKFNYFEFGDNYNLQTWRFVLGLEPGEKIASYVNVKNNKVYYKEKPLKFIHTHFNSTEFKSVNNFFINKLKEAKLWRELSIIYRVINDKWVLTIPKQPLNGKYHHNNDSYRELPLLFKLANKDVDLRFTDANGHCWLEPNILLYDRPTLEWLDNHIFKSSLILLGNGDIENEGKIIETKTNIKVKPWIFWARRPMIVEKILKDNGILDWENRKCESIFIGNFENNVQQKYRKTNENWESVLTEYHCTAGQKHKFTQQEYLMKLRESKYGLCLRGYGSKCHREVELMAFGTVPIVTKEVSISSYYEPPVENKHFIRANNPNELKEKISNITKEQWTEMSNNCYEWYQRNIYSKNAWENMIANILYS
jgi:hypothetical protein